MLPFALLQLFSSEKMCQDLSVRTELRSLLPTTLRRCPLMKYSLCVLHDPHLVSWWCGQCLCSSTQPFPGTFCMLAVVS